MLVRDLEQAESPLILMLPRMEQRDVHFPLGAENDRQQQQYEIIIIKGGSVY